MTVSNAVLGMLALAMLSSAALVDLHRVEANTLVIYTTPALQPYLEQVAIPAFEKAFRIPVVIVTLSAAEEYYRVRLSANRPEADLFLHASPLFLEKGYENGLFEPYVVPGYAGSPGNQSRPVQGGRIWTAFAWSPLVEVYDPGLPGPPDLTRGNERLGLGHPLLSNNGIYVVLLLEAAGPEGAASALSRTVVQPANARATVQGVADGSYDATISYEALVGTFKARGARVADSLPLIDGRQVTAPVLFSAAIVKGHLHEGADAFVSMLFTRSMQARLADYGMRPMVAGVPGPPDALDLSGAEILRYDWSNWHELEAKLSDYEVKG